MQLQAHLSRDINPTGDTMNDKKLGATLFAIGGLADKTFRLRVLKVREQVPQDSQTPIRMNKWATILWKNELKQAVVPMKIYGCPGFLTPDSETCLEGQIFTIEEDVPDRRYSVEVTSKLNEVKLQSAGKEELQVAAEMLKRVVSDSFSRQPNQFWRKHWNLYFKVAPENYNATEDQVYAYRGLRFAVIFIDASPFLAADIVTTYRGIHPLSDYSKQDWEGALYYHTSDQVELGDRGYFLRDNGPSKIPCQYVSDTRKSVSEYKLLIRNEEKSIQQYYAERYGIKLNANDPAVLVQDRGSAEKWPVPASRLFPIFKTDDDELRGCSVLPFLSPADRVSLIQSFLSDLSELQFGGSPLTINQKPLETERSYLTAPELEFRDGHTLALDESLPIEKAFANYRNGKLEMLYKYGTFSEQSLADLVFIYPDSMQRQVRETFQKQLSKEIRELSGMPPRIARQIEYRLGNQPASGAGLLKVADDIVHNNEGPVLPLVVLAEPFRDKVYELLKRRFRSMPSQCVTERTIKRLFRDGNAVGGSRLRNLALAILTAGGIQPWVLAKPLNYDFYMGVDLLFNQVIYVFVCGKGGRHVWVRRGTPRKRHFLTEKIDEFELADQFVDGVREAKTLVVEVNSAIVHRDGRWWSNEDQALTDAVTVLQSEKTVSAQFQIGVVEVHKSHLPARLFTINNNQSQPLENPIPGSFLVLNDSEVLLTSTGQPGPWDRQNRTARTLLLRIARNQTSNPIDIKKIAADAYGLTHLNWNAPEIEISLPVTIRWSDERLRETVLNSGAEETIENAEQEAFA
jgi:hypothetical protein